ncbi:retrovirus-related pol polyprotein from transposon TNT 1-94 [Tanacetum coccineum]
MVVLTQRIDDLTKGKSEKGLELLWQLLKMSLLWGRLMQGPKVVFGDDSSGDTEGYGSVRKMENLNEVRVKELRSDNGTKFRNHKLEEFCDEKGIS